MKLRIRRWFRFRCRHCGYQTMHEYLQDVQGDNGLVYRCERCRRTSEHTAHEATHA